MKTATREERVLDFVNKTLAPEPPVYCSRCHLKVHACKEHMQCPCGGVYLKEAVGES